MEIIAAIIILSAMALLFVFSLIWYFLKLRCLNYSGRAEGVITKAKYMEYTDPETKEIRLSRRITAEYEVEGVKYKARAFLGDCEPSEEILVTILYDEAAPKRYVFEQEIADPQKAKKRWLIAPAFAIAMAALALWALIPPLLGFTRRQQGIYSDIFGLIVVLLILVKGIMDRLKKYKDGKLTKKDMQRNILAVILIAAAICLFLFSLK